MDKMTIRRLRRSLSRKKAALDRLLDEQKVLEGPDWMSALRGLPKFSTCYGDEEDIRDVLARDELKMDKADKQHSGLRCKKCFVLLCRDEDIRMRNGKLCVEAPGFKWDGLVSVGDRVFCSNMHSVGRNMRSTYGLNTVDIPVLTIEKTTYVENFVRSKPP